MEIIEEVVKRVEFPFPKKRDDEFGAILSTVNTEIKNITLSFCLDKYPRTRTGLRNKFANCVDENNHWVPDDTSFSSYSDKTFVPIGMVAKEIIKIKGLLNPVKHWKITEAGEKYGQPIGAFTLKYAVDRNKSIYQYLGQTSSSGKTRSPFNRARIMEILYENGNISEKDVVNSLGRKKILLRDIFKLDKEGLIEHQSHSKEPGWIIYKWIEGRNSSEAKKVYGIKRSKEVAEYLYNKGESNRIEISKELNFENLKDISKVLNDLEKQDLIEPIKWSMDLKSELSILSDGKDFVENYIIPIRSALDDKKELQEMEDILHYFEEDNSDKSYYCNTGTDLYERVTPHLNRKSKQERKLEIIQILDKFNKRNTAPRYNEITEKLGTQPNKCLKSLLEEDMIYKDKKGKAVYYFLTEEGKKMV